MWVRDFRLHAKFMGKCKVTNDLLQQFSFARRIPGREDAIQCVFDRKIICVSNGKNSLIQHQETDIHKRHERSVELVRPIERAITTSVDLNDQKRKALILHVLRLVMENMSFHSSDVANSKRKMYSHMFPNSSLTAVCCGKTKASFLYL